MAVARHSFGGHFLDLTIEHSTVVFFFRWCITPRALLICGQQILTMKPLSAIRLCRRSEMNLSLLSENVQPVTS